MAPVQSDSLMRTAREIAAAEAIFGSPPTATARLRRPTTVPGGPMSLSLLDTSKGALIVEDQLARIDHGLATETALHLS